MLERRNDYVQARGRYCTMMDWERDDLVLNMGTLLGQCERDVQERMLWHLLLVHDDYGTRVGQMHRPDGRRRPRTSSRCRSRC